MTSSTLRAVIIVFLAPALASACGDSSRAKPGQLSVAATPPAGPVVLFDDDFATDRGWSSNVPAEIFIDTANARVSWEAHRDRVQHLSIPIPRISGDVTVEVTGTIDASINNCTLSVGLGDGLVGAAINLEPPGVYVLYGWTGGGCLGRTYFIEGRAHFANGTLASTNEPHDLCNSFYGNLLKIVPAHPYRVTLRTRGSQLELEVRDGTNAVLVGERTAQLAQPLGSYDRIFVANYGVNDWPYARGTVDRITITQP
jgi:hypothetical protein